MARTSGTRPVPRASVPAGWTQQGVVAQAITVDVPKGAKAALVAGQDVENPAATEQEPQRLSRR